MDLTKKVRNACWQATHDVNELRDNLKSAIESYEPQSETAEERTSVLEQFSNDMDEAVSTMQNINDLVLVNPTGYLEGIKFSRIVSQIPVEKLEYVSRLAQYAMQGLDMGVHQFADMFASGYYKDGQSAIDNMRRKADNFMEYAIEGNPMLDSLARVLCTKNMVDEAAEPVMKYITREKSE